MLFNSPQFAVFFGAVLLALRGTPQRARVHVLLGASLVFYALWIPIYLALLLGTLLVNYVLARRMLVSDRPRRYLVASIGSTLGLLVMFKYAGFAYDTLRPVLSALPTPPGRPELLLPLGISFYSFEVISLSVDLYKRRIACPSFARYALFVTFFPHLIAGPIMRGDELLPQLDAGGQQTAARARRGLWLVASGLAKKAILADYLLAPFVNEVFADAGAANAPTHLLAMYSFAFQIYFDFSGYTDMARGLACFLGFELPHNFLEPYLSRSPSELWRRWHISLSRWLRDYLYIPLGGSRHGAVRTGANLVLTMLLGGLWHGAGWTYVVWGGLHGAWLMIDRLLGIRSPEPEEEISSRDWLRVAWTFHVVCLLWVVFRAPTMAVALAFWQALFMRTYFASWPIVPLLAVIGCVLLHIAERWVRPRLPSWHRRFAQSAWGPAVEGFSFGALVMSALVCSGAGAEFIYFQF